MMDATMDCSMHRATDEALATTNCLDLGPHSAVGLLDTDEDTKSAGTVSPSNKKETRTNPSCHSVKGALLFFLALVLVGAWWHHNNCGGAKSNASSSSFSAKTTVPREHEARESSLVGPKRRETNNETLYYVSDATCHASNIALVGPTSVVSFLNPVHPQLQKAGGYTMEKMLTENDAPVKQLSVGRRRNVSNFDEWVETYPGYRVYMMESGYNLYRPSNESTRVHSITMFREPMTHVISQYFHCKEAKSHRRTGKYKFMPDTLLEWLQGWDEINQAQGSAAARNISNRKEHWSDEKYKCFIPLNFQSWLTNFPESKTEISAQFDAVGILEDMGKSMCVFLVQILGAVPSVCDCTDGRQVRTGTLDDGQLNIDHDVQHHGNSYIPSEEERTLIEKITNLDRVLYRQAKELFVERVAEIEAEHGGITLCGNED